LNRRANALAGIAAVVCLAGAAPTADVAPAVNLQMDTELNMGGVGVACTGIGESKQDPRWLSYPVRVEFSDMQQQYLVGAEVTLSTMRRVPLLHVTCQGAWLLLKLPDHNAYRLEASIIGASAPAQSRTVRSPARGQARVVIAFPGI
jgi:hypothetical protein